MSHVAEVERTRPSARQIECHPYLADRYAERLAAAERQDEAEANAYAVAYLDRRIAEKTAARKEALFNIVSADDLLGEQPPVPWVCEGLSCAPGAITLIGGYGFAGKTMCAQSFAVSVLSSSPVWGAFPVQRTGPVLHLDYEQGLRLTAERYKRLAHGMGVDVDVLRGLRLAPFPRGYIDTPGAIESINDLAAGAALVIVDSLRAAIPGVDENDSSIRTYLDALSRVSEHSGATILVIHHARKNDESGGARLLRGSSGIFDACQTVFTLEGEKGQPTAVRHVKDRLRGVPCDDFTIRVEDVDGRKGLRVIADLENAVTSQSERRITLFLQGRGGTFTGNRTALTKAVGGKAQTIMKTIATMIADGTLVSDGKTFSLP